MTANVFYARHLPHLAPPGSPIFVTWNLKGAMPSEVIEGLKQERERLERQPDRHGESSAARIIRQNKILFAAADRHLDQAVDGPMHLKDPQAAKIVEDAIFFGAGGRYQLFAWCVMSNHAHVVLTPGFREDGSHGSRLESSDVRGVRLESLTY